MLFAYKHQSDVNHVTGDIHFITLALKKRKTILTIHDLGFLNNSKNPFMKWILKTFWITLPVKHAAIITVVSNATREHLLSLTRINPEKVRVIGNFIRNSFQYSPKIFDNKRPNLLQIGSAYNKNLDRVIEAIKDIPCFLTVIGYPTESQKNNLNIYNIPHRILSGLTEEELIICYKECDILIFVSLLEGFGLPILEAQAIGRALITSNISSMPEIAGNAAIFVNPNDIISIREGILKIINDDSLRDELIRKGLENIKRFSLQQVTKQYTELYYEIVNSR
jgi:glycosyltransferase involved in cell wall biosynthesis